MADLYNDSDPVMNSTIGRSNISETLVADTEQAGEISVRLSIQLIQLLSEQLYQSPAKAIEELVVNAYDADATECRLYVPNSVDQDDEFIAVYDNGSGMDLKGLTNLWHVGDSPKKSERATDRLSRKCIGKFGIGKLATYTIANKLTYISRSAEDLLSVTIDYERLQSSPDGTSAPLHLPVRRFQRRQALIESAEFRRVSEYASIPASQLLSSEAPTWTIALLENLKPKASKIRLGRLAWVLRTAMPMTKSFDLFLNGDRIVSEKEGYTQVVAFDVADLPQRRLDALAETTGVRWTREGNSLTSAMFRQGISGSAYVFDKSLLGKSDDLARSNGFFVRVRERLVNQSDASFGIHSISSLETVNRFRADVYADDLDEYITATRENIEDTVAKSVFQQVLLEIYREARQRFEAQIEKRKSADARRTETERNYVNKWMVEYPVADALSASSLSDEGADADNGWFYLDVGNSADALKVAKQLYTDIESGKRPGKYRYEYSALGKTERMVKLDPSSGTFRINESHEFVRAHYDDGRSQALLEDMLTSEALLEVYLRGSSVPPHIVGETLEKRDALLRSLAQDHPYSLRLLASNLREARGYERDLEMGLIAAARAVGFVAKHLSNAKNPDGIARLTRYPGSEVVITLEAKSSDKVPSLSAIDFAGLAQHVRDLDADGCLLLAPDFPGQTNDDNAARNRAKADRISCWRIEDLARIVEVAEERQITADDILKIILAQFDPADVTSAVDKLLNQPTWAHVSLYRAIFAALRDLQDRLPTSQRTIDILSTEISRIADFRSITADNVRAAVRELSGASKGGMLLRRDVVQLNVSIEELERRVVGLTNVAGTPRRSGNFRSDG